METKPLKSWGEVSTSNYLQKEDVPSPVVVTIEAVRIAMFESNGVAQSKAVLEFREKVKPMVFNQTNQQILMALYPDVRDNPDHAVGKQVEIYCDPTIQMKGQVVGGLRIRKPQVDEVARLRKELEELQALKAAKAQENSDKDEFDKATLAAAREASKDDEIPF